MSHRLVTEKLGAASFPFYSRAKSNRYRDKLLTSDCILLHFISANNWNSPQQNQNYEDSRIVDKK